MYLTSTSDVGMSQLDALAFPPQSCPGFKGNPDFYGAGIRIGIYLQWASAWLSNTFNPAAAAANHDANSIFLLAVLIALTIALTNGSLRVVEAYIMGLLSGGFISTVLSFLGLRLYFLQPSTLATFFRGLSSVLKQMRENQVPLRLTFPTTLLGMIKGLEDVLKRYIVQISLNAASGVKHPALSWAGVMLRAMIGSFIAGLNIWLWFGPLPQQTAGSGKDRCDKLVFFFGHHEVGGSLLLAFKAFSIMLAVPVFYLCLVCFTFVMEMLLLVRGWVSRSVLINLMERSRKGRWDSLSKEEKAMLGMFVSGTYAQQMMNQPSTLMNMFATHRDILQEVKRIWAKPEVANGSNLQPQKEDATPSRNSSDDGFWTVKAADLPPLSELLQGFTSLWSRGIEIEEKDDAQAAPARFAQLNEFPRYFESSILTFSSRLEVLLSISMHITVLASMALLIAFIELSISGINISGVHNINTTG